MEVHYYRICVECDVKVNICSLPRPCTHEVMMKCICFIGKGLHRACILGTFCKEYTVNYQKMEHTLVMEQMQAKFSIVCSLYITDGPFKFERDTLILYK